MTLLLLTLSPTHSLTRSPTFDPALSFSLCPMLYFHPFPLLHFLLLHLSLSPTRFSSSLSPPFSFHPILVDLRLLPDLLPHSSPQSPRSVFGAEPRKPSGLRASLVVCTQAVTGLPRRTGRAAQLRFIQEVWGCGRCWGPSPRLAGWHRLNGSLLGRPLVFFFIGILVVRRCRHRGPHSSSHHTHRPPLARGPRICYAT